MKMFLDPKSGKRMETWNIVSGCLFRCSYCFARRLAEGRLRHLERYREGFDVVKFHEKELQRKFKPGGLVFVVDMGDLFGEWVPREHIQTIIEHTAKFPQTDFLFCTKNPQRYREFEFLPNAVLGTTLETNYDTPHFSVAPAPIDRFKSLMLKPHYRKFVSIEPIMDFDLSTMVRWVSHLHPEIVEVGADNYGCGLPEPPTDKVRHLLEELRKVCPWVVEKDGLRRLLNY